jgi:hypothetical protein
VLAVHGCTDAYLVEGRGSDFDMAGCLYYEAACWHNSPSREPVLQMDVALGRAWLLYNALLLLLLSFYGTPVCGGSKCVRVCLTFGCYLSFMRQQHCLVSVLCAQLSDSSPFVRLALLRSTCIFCRVGLPPTLALPDKRHPLLHICTSCSKACPQTRHACVPR